MSVRRTPSAPLPRPVPAVSAAHVISVGCRSIPRSFSVRERFQDGPAVWRSEETTFAFIVLGESQAAARRREEGYTWWKGGMEDSSLRTPVWNRSDGSATRLRGTSDDNDERGVIPWKYPEGIL